MKGDVIARKHRYGNLVFDRDAIVRAALRAYLEAFAGFGAGTRLTGGYVPDVRGAAVVGGSFSAR